MRQPSRKPSGAHYRSSRPFSLTELGAFFEHEWKNSDRRLSSIVHNLVPVVGVVALGWSSGLVLWSLCLDGLVALGLTFALLIHRLSLDPPVKKFSAAQFVVSWLLMMAIVGSPYYLGLGAQWDVMSEASAGLFAGSWLSLLALGIMVAADVFAMRGRWRRRKEVQPRRGALAREMTVHILRAVAVFSLLVIGATPLLAVAALALLYAYLEIFPTTTLMFFLGHPAPGSVHDDWQKLNKPETLFDALGEDESDR